MKHVVRSRIGHAVSVLLMLVASFAYASAPANAAPPTKVSAAHPQVDALVAAFKASSDPLAAENLIRFSKLTPAQVDQMEADLNNPQAPVNQVASAGPSTTSSLGDGSRFSFEARTFKSQRISASSKNASTARAGSVVPATIYDVSAYQTYDVKLFGIVFTRFRVDLDYQTNGSIVTTVPANGCLQSYRNYNPGVAMSNAGVKFTKFGNVGKCLALWNGNITVSAYIATVQKRGTYFVNGCCGVYNYTIENV